jgi:hypothetical protein
MGQVAPNEAKREELNNAYEENCRKAAEVIAKADYFLLATGAGFSADSGLAGTLILGNPKNSPYTVYKDIADVEAYRKRELTYSDLCVPMWLETDAPTFYGFWGGCFNGMEGRKEGRRRDKRVTYFQLLPPFPSSFPPYPLAPLIHSRLSLLLPSFLPSIPLKQPPQNP